MVDVGPKPNRRLEGAYERDMPTIFAQYSGWGMRRNLDLGDIWEADGDGSGTPPRKLMPSQHKNPPVSWHPADPTLKPWIEAEASQRGSLSGNYSTRP